MYKSLLDNISLKIINSWSWGYNPDSVLFLPQKTITFEGEKLEGLYTLTRDGKPCIKYVIRLVSDDLQTTLIHEMRHAWQDSQDRLYGLLSPNNGEDYENQPTELDARYWEYYYLFLKHSKREYIDKMIDCERCLIIL